mmetsp:Transcript_93601/g.264722  ORF Transcript_93601/g.264722 Transcript_93601/m.264722 type:complete len:296 (+) Transcript_93601:44-931(+)
MAGLAAADAEEQERYEALGALAGGPEHVQLVRERPSGRTWVRKAVRAAGMPARTRRMLLGEAEVLRRLDHPGIVKLREAFAGPREGDELALVLEHLPGGDCSELLRRCGGAIGEHAVARLAQQLLRALGHCHARGIVHRDVSPSNLALSEGWGCKLIDFGFAANTTGAEGELEDVVGTAPYMAPEMLARRPSYGCKVDVWSAGAVVCELLAGEPPFGRLDDSSNKVMRSIRSYAACKDPLAELERVPGWSQLSAGARGLLRGLLEADPQARPSADKAAEHSWLEERRLAPALLGA